jgi:hypothetical protein
MNIVRNSVKAILNFMGYEPSIIAKSVTVKNRIVHLRLLDGSTHSFPVAYYPRLASASAAALEKVKLRLGGKALRWENLDEDIWIGHAVIGRYPDAKQLAEA